MSAYLNTSTPEWGVHTPQCTPVGVEHMKAVGTHLMRTYFRDATTLEVKFISDESERDLVTSRALAKGLELGKEPNQVIHNHDLQVEPQLFYPTKRRPLCEQPDPDQLNLDISNRLAAVPQPPQTLQSALNFIQRTAGEGSLGPLEAVWEEHQQGGADGLGALNATTTTTATTTSSSSAPARPPAALNSHLHKLMGPINVVHIVATMAFASKASNISNFMPDWTLNETMGLLAWHYWKRSILSVHNSQSAMRGAALMIRVLQALQQNDDPEEEYVSQGQENNKHHHRVTFLVGHDSNLDGLATILNVSWELPQPYPSSRRDAGTEENMWFATPPASALYFARSSSSATKEDHGKRKEQLKVRMLAPMLLEENDEVGAHDPAGAGVVAVVAANTSGILESVPVVFHSNRDVTTALEDSTNVVVATRVSSTEIVGCNPVEALRNRVLEIATNVYPQALDCYNEAALVSRDHDDDEPPPNSSSMEERAHDDQHSGRGGTTPVTSVVVVAAAGAACALFFLLRHSRLTFLQEPSEQKLVVPLGSCANSQQPDDLDFSVQIELI